MIQSLGIEKHKYKASDQRQLPAIIAVSIVMPKGKDHSTLFIGDEDKVKLIIT